MTQFQNCSYLNSSSWSTNGLTTNATENNVTFCDSDHFTSFAVFVTPRRLPDDNLSRIASIVSYVLVSISFTALVISLILFLLSGKNFFKVEANIIYFNYCLGNDSSIRPFPVWDRKWEVSHNNVYDNSFSITLHLARCICLDFVQWNIDHVQAYYRRQFYLNYHLGVVLE